MIEIENSQNKNPSKEEFQSWDPLTQSKFIYEINKQAGTEISRQQSYETAFRALLYELGGGEVCER